MPILTLIGDSEAHLRERKEDLTYRITQAIENARDHQSEDILDILDEIISSQYEFTLRDFDDIILLTAARIGCLSLVNEYLYNVKDSGGSASIRDEETHDNILHFLCRSFVHPEENLGGYLMRRVRKGAMQFKDLESLLLQRNSSNLTPLQVCARAVDSSIAGDLPDHQLEVRKHRQDRFSSLAQLTLHGDDAVASIARLNPYDSFYKFRVRNADPTLDLVQPYRDVLSDEECRSCWSATEDALFHFDINLAFNDAAVICQQGKADIRETIEILDMTDRYWIHRWQQPDHGGLTPTQHELELMYRQLRMACIRANVQLVHWYLLFWDVPIQSPKNVPNPLGLSLMDYTIIGQNHHQMLSRDIRYIGSEKERIKGDLGGHAWAITAYTSLSGIWQGMFAQSDSGSVGMDSDGHTGRRYIMTTLRPSYNLKERAHIMRILLRQTGKLAVRLDYIIGHGRSEMLHWLISEKLIDLNCNVLLSANNKGVSGTQQENENVPQTHHDEKPVANAPEKEEGSESHSDTEKVSGGAGATAKRKANVEKFDSKTTKRSKLVPTTGKIDSEINMEEDGVEDQSCEISGKTKTAEDKSLHNEISVHDAECCVCLNAPRQWKKLECGHEVCVLCAVQLMMAVHERDGHADSDPLNSGEELSCPLCRASNPAPIFECLEDPVDTLMTFLGFTAPVLDEKIRKLIDSKDEESASQKSGPLVVTLHDLLVAFCASVGAVRPLNVLLKPDLFEKGYLKVRQTPPVLFRDESPMHMAASAGHHTVVWWYLRCAEDYVYSNRFKMANIDSLSSEGYHPIHSALLNDHASVVQMFMDTGRGDRKDASGRTFMDILNEDRNKYPNMLETIDVNAADEFYETALPDLVAKGATLEEIKAKATFVHMPFIYSSHYKLVYEHDRLDVLKWLLSKGNKDGVNLTFTSEIPSQNTKCGMFLALQRAQWELLRIAENEALINLLNGKDVSWDALMAACIEWQEHYRIVESELSEVEAKKYKLSKLWVRVLTRAVKATIKDDLDNHELGRLCVVKWVADRIDCEHDLPAVYSSWEYALLNNLQCVSVLKSKLTAAGFDFNARRTGETISYNDRLFAVYIYQPWNTTQCPEKASATLNLLREHLKETGATLCQMAPLETGLLALQFLVSQTTDEEFADTASRQRPIYSYREERYNYTTSHQQSIVSRLYQIITLYVEKLSTEEKVLLQVVQPMPRLGTDLVDSLIQIRHSEALRVLALTKGVDIQTRLVKQDRWAREQVFPSGCDEETFSREFAEIQVQQRER